jgi:hypothetical protein
MMCCQMSSDLTLAGVTLPQRCLETGESQESHHNIDASAGAAAHDQGGVSPRDQALHAKSGPPRAPRLGMSLQRISQPLPVQAVAVSETVAEQAPALALLV